MKGSRALTSEEKQFATYVNTVWQSKKGALKLTQAIASEKIGIGQAAFSMFINGETAMPDSFILNMSVLLEEPLFEAHPKLSKQVEKLKKIKIQEVQVPIMFALNKEKPSKKTTLITLPSTASSSVYAVQVATEDLVPYATHKQYLVVDPIARVTPTKMVLLNTLSGDNYVGTFTRENGVITIFHPVADTRIDMDESSVNFIHRIVGVFD